MHDECILQFYSKMSITEYRLKRPSNYYRTFFRGRCTRVNGIPAQGFCFVPERVIEIQDFESAFLSDDLELRSRNRVHVTFRPDDKQSRKIDRERCCQFVQVGCVLGESF